MEKINWKKLKEENYAEFAELYRRWMGTQENSMQCDNCPERCNVFDWLPCGQQNCWVDMTCK